jgi:putative tryptophan/tyrosine transport system substrate-binding protein
MQMQSGQLKRRELITLLGSAAVALPLRARAEQVDRLRMIAILGDNASVWSPWTTTLVGRLRELGWIEDRNVAFEYRWSGGQAEPVAEFAAEFVRQNVDAIVTYGGAVKTLRWANML